MKMNIRYCRKLNKSHSGIIKMRKEDCRASDPYLTAKRTELRLVCLLEGVA